MASYVPNERDRLLIRLWAHYYGPLNMQPTKEADYQSIEQVLRMNGVDVTSFSNQQIKALLNRDKGSDLTRFNGRQRLGGKHRPWTRTERLPTVNEAEESAWQDYTQQGDRM